MQSLKRGSRTAANGGFLKGKTTTQGYTEYLLSIAGRRIYRKAHQMVLETYRGPCPPGMEACHRDDVQAHNHLRNLRWDTKRANAKDRSRNGIGVGVTHGRCRLTEAQVYEIRRRADAGESATQLGKDFGIGQSHAHHIGSRRLWRHLPEVR